MADNVTLDAGSGGSTIATDECTVNSITAHVQWVKPAYGTHDSFTPVTTSAGLPVAQQGTWTVTGAGGSFPVTDSGGSLTVDAPVGTPVFVRLSDGSSAIATLPVSVASVPSHDVTNAGTFAVQAAQSGTWTVQPGNTANTTAWLVTGTNGTFPVTDSGGSLTVDAPVATPVFVRLSDGSSAIATLPVSIAATVTVTGTGGTFPVTDSGGSLTVDNGGTFAVQESGGVLTALQIIDDWDESDRCKVNPIAGQAGVAAGAGAVGATVQRVTLASDDPAVVSLAALDNAVSGNELQVDVVGALPAGTALIGRVSASPETSAIYEGATALTPKFAAIDAATSGDNTLVAAVASKKVRVLALFLVAAGAVNARFESGAGGSALSGQMNLTTNSGFCLPFNPAGWFETAANTLLNLELSGAVSVDGCLTYIEVS